MLTQFEQRLIVIFYLNLTEGFVDIYYFDLSKHLLTSVTSI